MLPSAELATLVFALLPTVTLAQTADGAIVPFSTLPACASKCGPLFDVQGACAPPVQAVNDQCFCTDTRLTPFTQSLSEVQSVCGAESCTAQSDLQAIQTWYENFCKSGKDSGASVTTSGAAGATSTGDSGSSNGNTGVSSSGPGQSWLQSHVKWIVMLVILAIGIPAVWVGAWLLRKRYIRKKEREFEMRSPVAIGPHQLQAMTNGYEYGDGVVNANGREKGPDIMATPANAQKAGKKGLKKERR